MLECVRAASRSEARDNHAVARDLDLVPRLYFIEQGEELGFGLCGSQLPVHMVRVQAGTSGCARVTTPTERDRANQGSLATPEGTGPVEDTAGPRLTLD